MLKTLLLSVTMHGIRPLIEQRMRLPAPHDVGASDGDGEGTGLSVGAVGK